MFPAVPQYVPQEVCLKCDGCCRFKDDNTRWRPRIGMDEVTYLQSQRPTLAQRIFGPDAMDAQGGITTRERNGVCQCRFFDEDRNACGIYPQRPFECRLYPFLLCRHQGQIYLSVHLACPQILETRYDEAFEAFIARLKDYFRQPETISFVKGNDNLVGDYAEYEEEIEHLWPVAVSTMSEEEDLWDQRLNFHRQRIDGATPLSVTSFPQLFVWKDAFRFECVDVAGATAVIAHHATGSFFYLPPLGRSLDEELLDACFALLKQKVGDQPGQRVEQVSYAQVQKLSRDKYKIHHKGYETCYYKADLVRLRGKEYKSKRGDVNQFCRNYQPVYRSYDSSMKAECRSLFQRWSQERLASGSRDDVYCHMLEENEHVHAHCLEHFERLGLTGRVVEVDGQIEGYTFGYALSRKTFCVFLEVASTRLRGLPAYIFKTFCADAAWEGFDFVNVMDDFGLPGVARAKQLFRPVLAVPVYSVELYA